MAGKAVLTINNVTVPTPTKHDISLSDLDGEKTGRDLDYKMRRSRKRSEVYSLELAWENINIKELKIIRNAVKPEFVNVYFFDPSSGTHISKTMYAGDKKITTKMVKGDFTKAVGSISFNLIEQ